MWRWLCSGGSCGGGYALEGHVEVVPSLSWVPVLLQEQEILATRWMPLDEFVRQEFFQSMPLHVRLMERWVFLWVC